MRGCLPLIAALCVATVVSADPGPTSEGLQLACLQRGLTSTPSPTLVPEALDVLQQAGHDPADYSLELRREHSTHPDLPELGGEPTTSVVFEPIDGIRHYPVRVHPASPCGLGWIWRPESFTEWQRGVIERARAAASHHLAGRATVPPPSAVEVLESRDLVGVRWWSPVRAVSSARDGRGVLIVIRKKDLGLVDVVESRGMR